MHTCSLSHCPLREKIQKERIGILLSWVKWTCWLWFTNLSSTVLTILIRKTLLGSSLTSPALLDCHSFFYSNTWIQTVTWGWDTRITENPVLQNPKLLFFMAWLRLCFEKWRGVSYIPLFFKESDFSWTQDYGLTISLSYAVPFYVTSLGYPAGPHTACWPKMSMGKVLGCPLIEFSHVGLFISCGSKSAEAEDWVSPGRMCKHRACIRHHCLIGSISQGRTIMSTPFHLDHL